MPASLIRKHSLLYILPREQRKRAHLDRRLAIAVGMQRGTSRYSQFDEAPQPIRRRGFLVDEFSLSSDRLRQWPATARLATSLLVEQNDE
jgi:hypothetical protein